MTSVGWPWCLSLNTIPENSELIPIRIHRRFQELESESVNDIISIGKLSTENVIKGVGVNLGSCSYAEFVRNYFQMKEKDFQRGFKVTSQEKLYLYPRLTSSWTTEPLYEINNQINIKGIFGNCSFTIRILIYKFVLWQKKVPRKGYMLYIHSRNCLDGPVRKM